MEELLRSTSARGRLPKLVRGSLAGMGLVLAGVIVLVVTDQMRNEIVIINETPAPVDFNLAKLFPSHATDLTIPPHTKVVQSLRGPSSPSLVMVAERVQLFAGDPKRYSAAMNLPRWGNRIVIIENEKRSTSITKSTLRAWIDANRNWLPFPEKWFY